MTAPCLGCKDRCVGCHADCDRYKEFREQMDAVLEARAQIKAQEAVFHDAVNKTCRRIRRTRK